MNARLPDWLKSTRGFATTLVLLLFMYAVVRELQNVGAVKDVALIIVSYYFGTRGHEKPGTGGGA